MASRLQDVLLRGVAASRPLATAVANGTLYFATDTGVTTQSDGATWNTYSATVSAGYVPTVVVAAASESVTNDTMQPDNELLLAVAASTVYVLELVAFFTTGTSTAVDMKIGFTFPAAAVMTYGILGYSATPTSNSRGTISTSVSSGSPLWMKGVLRTGVNAGTLTFQWAQGVTTGGTPLVREANSLLRLQRV